MTFEQPEWEKWEKSEGTAVALSNLKRSIYFLNQSITGDIYLISSMLRKWC